MTALTIAGLIWFVVILAVTQSRAFFQRPDQQDNDRLDRDEEARRDLERFKQLDEQALRSGRR